MDVRPNTCHGQMGLLVVRTSGASGPSVSANMDRKLGDRWMELGETGRVGAAVPDLVVEELENQ